MRALVLLAMLGCASTTARPPHRAPPPPPQREQPKPSQITLDAITAGVDVATGDELVHALADKQQPVARVVEVVQVTWRDHTFGKDVLAEMIQHNTDAAYRATFRDRYHEEYDDVWRVFLHGYAAQLAERFGLVPADWGMTFENGRWLLIIFGKLPNQTQVIEWKSGVFAHSNHGVTPPPVLATTPTTLETVLFAERGDYYALPQLNNASAYFRPRGDEPASDKLFKGAVYRMYVDKVAYTDANGRAYQSAVTMRRATPYFTLRPGGLDRLGLKRGMHVVRLELDGTGLLGSAPLIHDVTVLDGTPAFAADLDKAYAQIVQRFDGEARAAEAKLAADIAATEHAFATKRTEWARSVKPPGPLQSDKGEHVSQRPSFQWDSKTKTLMIAMHREHTVVLHDKIAYRNPELDHWSCPPGVPCAVPPGELYHELDQRYVIDVSATYVIDSDGTVRSPRAATGFVRRQ